MLISQHLFTDDPLSDLRFTGPVESTIRVNGSGAIGYDEYVGNHRIPDFSSLLCSFMGTKTEEMRSDELASSGLMQNGHLIRIKIVVFFPLSKLCEFEQWLSVPFFKLMSFTSVQTKQHNHDRNTIEVKIPVFGVYKKLEQRGNNPTPCSGNGPPLFSVTKTRMSSATSGFQMTGMLSSLNTVQRQRNCKWD